MNPEDVALYLRSNPAFFEEHPELLESIYVPHPHGGRAISLAERQILSLREKAKLLEGKLGELIQFGEENDTISERVHRLSVALVAAGDLVAFNHALMFHLREDFSVPHVAVRVWNRELPDPLSDLGSFTEAERAFAAAMNGPQCGAAAGSTLLGWFGEAAPHVRSVAWVPLGEPDVIGVLALGSEDAERFYPEMGTLYLRRIGELCAAGLAQRPPAPTP